MSPTDVLARTATFMGLPAKQSEAFEQIALLSDGTEYARSTLKALEKKGLIVGTDEKVYGSGSGPIDRIPITVRRYHVPLPIHAQWCQWCADNFTEEDAP